MDDLSCQVSVVIPTFNRNATILRAVESVLRQTFQDFELIIVDDGSTDDTAQQLGGFSERIKYLRQENRGVSAARNRGIHASNSEWLAFLDSDDAWKPAKLATQLEFVKQDPKVRVVQTEEIWIRRGERVNPKKYHQKLSGWIFPQMLKRCLVSPSAAMVHRTVFDKIGFFDESLPACEDYDFWLRANLRYAMNLIPEPLIIKYGGHQDQLSAAWGLDRWRIQSLLKIREREVLPDDWKRDLNLELIEKCRIFAAGLEKHGKAEEAESYYRIALKTEELLRGLGCDYA